MIPETTRSTHDRRPLRLLHTSDTHLGPPGREPRGRPHAYECVCPIDILEHLTDEHGVDVVMLVGDLFDHARVSEQLVRETFKRLGELPTTVVLVPGNHDVMDGTALYRRYRDAVDASGIIFFDDPEGRTVDLAGGAMRLWAKSMEDHHPGYKPLVGVPEHPGDRWFVVAGHGHFSLHGDEYRSSPISLAHLNDTDADYVALGHWHVTTDLSAKGATLPAWYSGATLFGHGAGQLLMVDLVPGEGAQITTLDIQDHPASQCTA